MRLRYPAILFTALTLLSCGGDGKTPTQPTTPPAPGITLTSISVGVSGNAPAMMAPGDKLQLYAEAVFSDGSKSDVTNVASWQSSNPLVATVSTSGLVTAAAEGAFDVSAAYQGRSGAVHAEVQKPSCRATLSPDTLVFGPFGASGTVTVTTTRSDCRWTARSDAGWLSYSYDPNRSGDGSFSYQVPGNSTPQARSAHIVVSVVGGPDALHTIQQERPAGCSYVVTPEKASFPNTGGTGAFDLVTTPSDCQWTAAGLAGYGRVTGPTSGTGNARISYVVNPNPYSGEARTAVEVRGLSGLNPPGVHTVTIAPK